MRSAFDMVSAWASVLATTKSTPCRPALIMLLTALPPAPPTPGPGRSAIGRCDGVAALLGAIRNSREAIVRLGRNSRPYPSADAVSGVVRNVRDARPADRPR